MTNSDYLIKAAIKKVTEKLNNIFSEKIEEVTNIAQDAPEIIKKELDILKESIIEEAKRMENETNTYKNSNVSKTYKNPEKSFALKEMQEINEKIEQLNKKMNTQI